MHLIDTMKTGHTNSKKNAKKKLLTVKGAVILVRQIQQASCRVGKSISQEQPHPFGLSRTRLSLIDALKHRDKNYETT